ncbi:hypothetical protein AKJ09_05729 [Labilithrix luteola]|uniref:Uncharacterized protein n=1 Tax=Labilithrix luteola TaxID=1391654 RepID=A0A0K1PZV4_9BACT|nr:hypothetical protein AKJ09_05729 [Labilithrix luteola]
MKADTLSGEPGQAGTDGSSASSIGALSADAGVAEDVHAF